VTPGYFSILCHSSLFGDETLESKNIWVNSRVIRQCATQSPGHNAGKLAITSQRAARITLASVFTSTRHTSTDHVDSDSAVIGISSIAYCTVYDCYFDCLELICKWATWSGSSAATYYTSCTSSGFCGCQGNWPNSWSVGEWRRYLKLYTEVIERFCRKAGCFTWNDLRNYKSFGDIYSIVPILCLPRLLQCV
jgi:hypothetical protein